ncbi:MAG: FtsX-like permease family protein [Sulfolobales archaeon]
MRREILYLIDLMKLASKALTERRLRAVLTIVGISIGPFIMVMMGSVISGYSSYIISSITSLGQNGIIIFPGGGYKLTENDLSYIRSLPHVVRAEPFYYTQGFARICGSEERVYVYAIDLDFIFQVVRNAEILKGVLPSPTELSNALAGYRIMFDSKGNQCYNLGDVISVSVSIYQSGKGLVRKNLNLMISAVLKEYGGALFFSPDSTLFINYDAGRKILGMDTWSGIIVLADDPMNVRGIADTLRNYFSGNADVIAFSAIADSVGSVTKVVDFINFTTSLSAFAVAVAGVAATMITSVIERYRELGVMKAIGYTSRSILLLILLESVIMSLIGAAIGISLGIVGAYMLSSQGLVFKGFISGSSIVIYAPPNITANLLLSVLALTIFVGVLGGLMPAYRASRIPPAVALRYE